MGSELGSPEYGPLCPPVQPFGTHLTAGFFFQADDEGSIPFTRSKVFKYLADRGHLPDLG
jgi:hypothetical protein